MAYLRECRHCGLEPGEHGPADKCLFDHTFYEPRQGPEKLTYRMMRRRLRVAQERVRGSRT